MGWHTGWVTRQKMFVEKQMHGRGGSLQFIPTGNTWAVVIIVLHSTTIENGELSVSDATQPNIEVARFKPHQVCRPQATELELTITYWFSAEIQHLGVLSEVCITTMRVINVIPFLFWSSPKSRGVPALVW